MDLSLDGQTALVIGASGGIGQAVARTMAGHGARVAAGYHTGEKQARAVVARIREYGGTARPVAVDVTEAESIRRLFSDVEAEWGAPNILYNGAGIAENGPVAGLSDTQIERVLAVNLKGTLYACRAAADRLAEGGRIVNVSTGLTNRPEAGFGLYASSKAAVETLTRSLADELGNRGITVNAVQPGPTEPGMFEQVPPEARERRTADSYFDRIGRAEEVAEVVAFLASGAAGWISGQTICVDGGIMS